LRASILREFRERNKNWSKIKELKSFLNHPNHSRKELIGKSSERKEKLEEEVTSKRGKEVKEGKF
jgi:hypothetical protein